jgi:hypothetical protein
LDQRYNNHFSSDFQLLFGPASLQDPISDFARKSTEASISDADSEGFDFSDLPPACNDKMQNSGNIRQ